MGASSQGGAGEWRIFFSPANVLTFKDRAREAHGDQEHLRIMMVIYKKKKKDGTWVSQSE